MPKCRNRSFSGNNFQVDSAGTAKLGFHGFAPVAQAAQVVNCTDPSPVGAAGHCDAAQLTALWNNVKAINAALTALGLLNNK